MFDNNINQVLEILDIEDANHFRKFDSKVILCLQYYICYDLTGGSFILRCQPAKISLGGEA